MDFGEHVLATSQEVKEFISNDGPGPSLDDLHLDCHRGKTSLWNKSAMEMMTAKFAEEMKTWTGLKSHYISSRAWFGIDLLTSWVFGEECSCVLTRTV